MAFDQNTVPIDLRFLNVTSTMSDDARVVPLTTTTGRNTIESFYTNPRDGGSPNSIPLYYPSTVSDAGLLGVGCGSKISGVSGWVPMMPTTTVINPATVNTAATAGHCYNPSSDFGSRTGSNVSDQVSDEGGDDSSLSGKKLKFMCSFGGKILPRPSDGTLRYVGGQTRIISVRKEVSYYELVQKLVDIYGQNLVIKYQLPEEDLDALVSVSCQDDLINMMDEYNKLVDRSSDGSSNKLRVFLFSTSELDSPSLGQLGDLESSGQRYVEAVNGIGDGAVTGGSSNSIMRRDSITSASTQNSDCGNEGADNSTHSPGNFSGTPSTGELSPRGNFATSSSQETSPRLVCLDTNNSGAIYVEASSCAPLAIPMVKSQILSPRNEQEFVNVQRQQVGYYDLPAGSYVQSFIDPHQKVINRTEYVQTGHHQGQLIGTTSTANNTTMYTQQQYHNDNNNNNTPSHHYIPAIQMPMNHSSHVRIRPNQVRPVVQTQQVPFECYADQESSFGQRVGQFTSENNSYNTYQSQANNPSMAAFCDGWVPHHQQVKFYDKNPKYYEDCYMCQKMLPHTHSDTISPNDQKDSSSSTLSSPNSVYESPPSVDNIRVCPTNKTSQIVSDHPFGEKQGGIGSFQNFEPLYEIDKTDHSKVGVTRLTGGKQSPYGVVMGTIPQLCQENIVQQLVMPTQFIKQEDLMSKPIYEDTNSSIGRTSSSQISDHQFHEIFPKDYSAELRGINPTNPEPCFTYDARQIDRKVKNLQITPPEVVFATEIKSPVDNNLNKEQDMNILKQNPMIPCSLSDGPYGSSSAFSGGDSSHLTEKVSPTSEWNDIASQLQAQIVHNEIDVTPSSGRFSSISTIGSKVGDTPDSSNSLFSNQHLWNLRHDTHLRPPFSGSRLSRESPMHSSGSSIADSRSEDVVYDTSYNSPMDLGQEQVRCFKGLTEERIKQDLQAVAEGVAVSVLQPIMHSNSQSIIPGKVESSEVNQIHEIKNIETETRHGDKFEDMSAKITEKANFGSPVSDGFGRLQIIKDCDLEELRELGSGTFGTVYHGKWRGSDVAIKRINDRCFAGKPSEQERMRDDFWNEAIKLGDLHHPNVVAFYGVVLDGPEDTVATVTEYMANGSLRNAIEKNERNLDNRKRLIIAMDVAFGMEYLHGKNIVHFDLKSDNLLVNLRDPHRPICKVGDLGLSKVKCQTLISGGVRGTLPWMAPELLNGSSSLVSEKVDVFSFGMVMWELLTGDEPYGDLHYGAIIGGIVSNTLRPPVPETCDPDWRTLMERCWSSDPSERPSFTEIANQLRVIASKVPPRGQNQQSPLSPQMQVKT